jgi:hypothetical protein
MKSQGRIEKKTCSWFNRETFILADVNFSQKELVLNTEVLKKLGVDINSLGLSSSLSEQICCKQHVRKQE